MGFLFTLDGVSQIYIHLVFGIAVFHTIKTYNKHNEALLWSMYIVSFEVLMHMSGGLLFHASVKYMVMLLLGMGLFMDDRKPLPVVFVLYLLLMSIGIAFTEVPAGEYIRKAIAFNLSGPFTLGIAAIYCYNRSIDKNTLKQLLWIGSLPLIALLGYLYFKTPNLEEIGFNTEANFDTSGGYGPNQVSTILGFGMFLIVAMILLKKRVSGFLLIDILLLTYMTFRGFLTFSRGGVITGILAIIAVSIFSLLHSKQSIFNVLKFAVVVLTIGIGVLLYASNATDGLLINRYMNKTAKGEQSKDFSTGRLKIIGKDLELFYENPFFGVGVGSGKYLRAKKEGEVAASHNEMTRMLSEHGMIGLLALLLLLIVPLFNFFDNSTQFKGYVIAFYVFWFLTINHSAMRLAFPGFIYGLSLLKIYNSINENNSLHRE
ncbi:MAG: hypothetical protein CR968_04075 [Flavobacteriia bacterium]|nr:MAG: hypothetical protein CR968_04075 [Flavobacteriia bacterium]